MASFDERVRAVISKKEEWANTPASKRVKILRRMRDLLDIHREEWATVAKNQRGYGGDDERHVMGHMQSETYNGPAMTGTFLNLLIESYEALDKGMEGVPPISVRSIGDQKAAKVFPRGVLWTAFASGMEMEVWSTPGNGISQHNPCKKPAGVSTVLGAGNYDAPNDILTSIFCDNHVVLFKTNPVNEKTGAVVEKIFSPLIDENFLACFHGDHTVGASLLSLEEMDQWTITGSHHTVNRILWGSPEEQEKNIKAGDKKLKKDMVAELGSVNPFIVVPGNAPWTRKQIDHHAQMLVQAKLSNAGHICASPQVIITDGRWKQREEFVKRVRHYLEEHPGVKSYYPNCKRMWEEHRKQVSDDDVVIAPELEPGQPDKLDRIFKSGLKLEDGNAYALKNEAFCSVLTEWPMTMAEDASVIDFFNTAVDFANNQCWGSLTATISLPDEFKLSHYDEVNECIRKLKVGAVGVNIWAATAAAFGQLPWGAYPGHTPEDVQSGIGKVNNFYFYENLERGVIWAPFEYMAAGKVPNPSVAAKFGPRFAAFTTKPSVFRLLKLVSGLIIGL